MKSLLFFSLGLAALGGALVNGQRMNSQPFSPLARESAFADVDATFVGEGRLPAARGSLAANSFAAPTNLSTLNVQSDFGARGDGRTDDTRAFALLSQEVNRRGGGVRIVIPRGNYLVGGQVPNGKAQDDGKTYRFAGRDVLSFANCARPIRIEGAGARLRLPDGLRFGSFDERGEVLNPRLPFYDTRAAGTTGFMVRAFGCADVSVAGLELDGRNTTYKLGGAWGDKDRQARSYGFLFDWCGRVELQSVSAHHFGLDGLYIKAPGIKDGDAARPHILRNSRFEWNGRQGLSWSGGIGLLAQDCVFAHTGYAQNQSGQPVYNSPGAGVDIEAEGGVCRDGKFVRCQFFHTRGPALYAQVGDIKGVSFESCTFWNFANYALVPDVPRLSFFDCQVFGGATSAYSSFERPGDAVRFVRTTFEDRAHPQFGRPFADAYGSLVSFDNLKEGVVFEDCRFLARRVKGPFLRAPRGDQTRGFRIQGGSLRLEHWNKPDESLATMQGGTVSDFSVETAFAKSPPRGLHLWTNRQTTFAGLRGRARAQGDRVGLEASR